MAPVRAVKALLGATAYVRAPPPVRVPAGTVIQLGKPNGVHPHNAPVATFTLNEPPAGGTVMLRVSSAKPQPLAAWKIENAAPLTFNIAERAVVSGFAITLYWK